MEEKKELLDQDERVVEIELERLRGFVNHALKDLLGGTIKEMMEAEMDDHLGYKKSERSDSDQKIISMYAKGMTTRQISDPLYRCHPLFRTR